MSLFIACAMICCTFFGFPASASSTQSNIVVKMSDFYNKNSNNRRELSNHLKQKFENQCMLTFEGNKNTLDKKQIYDDIGISCGFSTASIDNEAKKMDNNLVGLSLQNIGGTTYINEYYMIKDDKNDSDIDKYVTQESNKKLIKSKNITNQSVMTVSASTSSNSNNYDYSRTYSWYSGSKLLCSLQTTKKFTRTRKSNVSIWQVVSADSSISHYLALYNQCIRLSVENISGESVVDHSPGSTSGQSSVSIGLSGAGIPTISYTQSLPGVDIIDYYAPPKYARWEYDYYSPSARGNVFVARPAAEFENTFGEFMVDISNTLFDSSWQTRYTGTTRMYFTDR